VDNSDKTVIGQRIKDAIYDPAIQVMIGIKFGDDREKKVDHHSVAVGLTESGTHSITDGRSTADPATVKVTTPGLVSRCRRNGNPRADRTPEQARPTIETPR
jgi:hypothetical protein